MADALDFVRLVPNADPVVIFEPAPDRQLVCDLAISCEQGNFVLTLEPGQVLHLAQQLTYLINLPADDVSALIDRVHQRKANP